MVFGVLYIGYNKSCFSSAFFNHQFDNKGQEFHYCVQTWIILQTSRTFILEVEISHNEKCLGCGILLICTFCLVLFGF